MRQTAIVVAPGRGTYNRDELGYLARHHGEKQALIRDFDAFRADQGQTPISALDGADRFSGPIHTRGDNAAALIHACAFADFQSIDRDRFDILAVTGNSMGWYIALACAGALTPLNGLRVVNTMGTLMHEHMIGGQLVYPLMDDTWTEVPGRREAILEAISDINGRKDHVLALSIDLGGMLVLAGNGPGLAAFETALPRLDRYPLRLPGHAAFHTALQDPVATQGRAVLDKGLFQQPALPLIDGRGGIWWPKASDLPALYRYTLGQQVVEPYDFAGAIRTAARELMPDVFIVLGPGPTLGGAVIQSLIQANWRGWSNRADFEDAQTEQTRVLSMGRADQRPRVQIAADQNR